MAVTNLCTSVITNPGYGGCKRMNPFLDPVGLAITTDGFSFAAGTNFATESDWQAGIDAQTVFPLQNIQVFEDQSEETMYYDAPNGKRIKRRNGKYRYKFSFDYDLETHKKLQTFNGMDARLFVFDADGNILGYTSDGTIIKGFKLSMVSVEKMTPAQQDNTPAFTVLVVGMEDSNEWNLTGEFVNPSWDIESLDSLAEVDLAEVGSTSSSALVVSVYFDDGFTTAGVVNNIPIIGLLEADFTILTAAGGAGATPTGFTDEGDGTYSFTFGADLATGTIDLVTPASITTGLNIISSGSASFTVV